MDPSHFSSWLASQSVYPQAMYAQQLAQLQYAQQLQMVAAQQAYFQSMQTADRTMFPHFMPGGFLGGMPPFLPHSSSTPSSAELLRMSASAATTAMMPVPALVKTEPQVASSVPFVAPTRSAFMRPSRDSAISQSPLQGAQSPPDNVALSDASSQRTTSRRGSVHESSDTNATSSGLDLLVRVMEVSSMSKPVELSVPTHQQVPKLYVPQPTGLPRAHPHSMSMAASILERIQTEPRATMPDPNIERIMSRKHVCGVCSKRFSCSSNLKRHQSIHTGYKPYKCEHCAHTFSNSSNRRKHEKTHLKRLATLANTVPSSMARRFSDDDENALHNDNEDDENFSDTESHMSGDSDMPPPPIELAPLSGGQRA